MSWASLLSDVETEYAALDQLLAGMTEQQWDAPTPAEGWNSRDQIAHLAYYDDKAALSANPEAFAAHLQVLAEGGFDAMTQGYLDDGRSLTGSETREWWRRARFEMLNTFSNLEPKDRLPWYGPPMSARSSMTARLMETWAHGVDIADTIGAEPPATDRLKHICHLGTVTVGWSYRNRGLPMPTEPIRFQLTSPAGEEWGWGESNENFIAGPALDFALLVTQRRNLSSLNLSITGHFAESYSKIAQCFAGSPTDGPQDD